MSSTETKEIERLVACAELRNPKVFNANRERYLAEISFKAGEHKSDKKWRQILKDTVALTKLAGIKEVVDWLEQNCDHTYEYAYGQWAFTVRDFNGKLYEWGIDKSQKRM